MKRILFTSLVLAVVVSTTTVAQDRVGTTAATFLTLGTGARGTALGHAYTAIATGPDALYWNPGGASRMGSGGSRSGVMFTHHEWFADINYNAVAVVVPAFGASVLGLSIGSVDYGTMDVRTVSQPNGTGETFSAADLVIGFTYAMPLTNTFHFGGTAKYVSQHIRDMSASTVAFDFGFVLETRYLNGLQLAASIMNFGGKMRMDGINSERNIDIAPGSTGSSESIPVRVRMDAWDLPIAFKFGVALPVVSAGNLELLLLADANQTNDNGLNSDFGSQLRYSTKTVSFDARLGWRDAFLDNVDSHLSYGAGLDVQVSSVRFGFDFAYVPFDFLDDVRLIDFRVTF